MSAIVISDVHLKDATSVKTQLILRFLQKVASQFEEICILGDLFDVWPGTNPYLIKTYGPVLDVLRDLVRDGHRVDYVEGNHDFRLGSFFQEQLGVHVHPDHLERRWGGHRVLLAHGDLGNPHERGYRVLRKLLRHDFVQQVAQRVPAPWVYALGDRASRASRMFQKKVPPDLEAIRLIYRQTAEGYFSQGYDVVVMGHTHLPDAYAATVSGRSCRYFNTGDWVTNFTYLEFDGREFYTKTHPIKSP